MTSRREAGVPRARGGSGGRGARGEAEAEAAQARGRAEGTRPPWSRGGSSRSRRECGGTAARGGAGPGTPAGGAGGSGRGKGRGARGGTRPAQPSPPRWAPGAVCAHRAAGGGRGKRHPAALPAVHPSGSAKMLKGWSISLMGRAGSWAWSVWRKESHQSMQISPGSVRGWFQTLCSGAQQRDKEQWP